MQITYYLNGGSAGREDGSPWPANSRDTVAVHDAAQGVGRGQEVSAKVESTNGVGIVVERPMYFTYAGGLTTSPAATTSWASSAPRQVLALRRGLHRRRASTST